MTDTLAVLECQNDKGVIGALRTVTPVAPAVVANFCAAFHISPVEFLRWTDYPMPSLSLSYPDLNFMQSLWTLSAHHGWPQPGPNDLEDPFTMGHGRGAGPVAGSVHNSEVALRRLGISRELRYNRWTGKHEYRGKDIDSKTLLPPLRRMAEALYVGRRFVPTENALWAAICAEALARPYHPVIDLLRSLTWDGFDRLSHLGEYAFGQEPGDELANEISALIVRGAVVRALHPGAHFPYMPIIGSSQQGASKRDALRLLAPGRYIEGISFRGFDWQKKIQEKTRGVSIAEVGEVDSIGGDELSNLKSLVTDDTLDNREAYAREAVTRQLTAILVGTTNNQSFLTDSEHRRNPVLWIPDGKSIDVNWLAVHKLQLWAQVVAEYDTNRFWEPEMEQHAVRLPKHLWEAANENSKQFEIMNDLAVWLETVLGNIPIGMAVLASDLANVRNQAHVKASNKEFSRGMDTAGWQIYTCHLGGKRPARRGDARGTRLHSLPRRPT